MCLNGFGILAVSTSSVTLSELTAGPNGQTFPTNIYTVTVYNAGAGNLFLAPLGGTAAAATCLPIAPGGSWTINLNGKTTSPTIISDSSATAVVTW
jgi:hypothetical protein